MGSVERSKKKVQLWKKAVVHFSLCFVMGFFTGFAPSAKTSIFSSIHDNKNNNFLSSNKSHFFPQPIEMLHLALTPQPTSSSQTPLPTPSEPARHLETENEDEEEAMPRKLIIIITPTTAKIRYREVLLRRLANTIRLVAPPLLWVVVQGQTENKVSEILRKTGIMCRHLVSKENFTDVRSELDHQRNVALRHIEHHRLSGIVHFADLSNVYDLSFFNELREIEGFGTWPMALLSANKKKVRIEGPVCDSSQVIGWHLKKINNETEESQSPLFHIHISSFAFNSSILWDPERWGRPSSVPHASQNSIKYVKQAALEDETKLKGIPPEECSKIMLWQLNFAVDNELSDNILNIASDNNRT